MALYSACKSVILFTATLGLAFLTMDVLQCMRNFRCSSIVGSPWSSNSQRYATIEVNDEKIEYHGRWVSTPNRSGRDASFGGSSFEFVVTNTTSVYMLLANSYTQHSSSLKNDKAASLVLTPAQGQQTEEGPVSYFSTINGSLVATYHHNEYVIDSLAYHLDPNAVHHIRVTLPHINKPNTIQFRGLKVRKGGFLVSVGESNETTFADTNQHTMLNTGKQNKLGDTVTLPTLIEIMAPMTLLSHSCSGSDLAGPPKSWATSWSTLLQDHFHSTTFSTVPVGSTSCLTKRCNTSESPQRTFLRSGPPNTTLHSHLWSFSSKTSKPGALLLSLTLSDIEHYLSTFTHKKHDFTAFVDDVSHNYSKFIQMIRRAAYSPSNLADRNLQTPTDESHLYNSAPSTLPIFLVLPPVPSRLLVKDATKIKSIMHHIATKTINDLKWNIGDQKTIIIDTSGWLNDDDFTLCQADLADSEAKSVKPSDFILTQSGHIKFAHHLSLHLCPWLKKDCEFDRHGEYVGNLVVPGIEGVGKALESKRVGRISEIFKVTKD